MTTLVLYAGGAVAVAAAAYWLKQRYGTSFSTGAAGGVALPQV